MLYDRIGLDPTTVGSSLIERAVQRRMRHCRVHDPAAYAARLSVDEQEILGLPEEIRLRNHDFLHELQDFLCIHGQARGVRDRIMHATVAHAPLHRALDE